jgi:hypothetical protein
MRLPNNTVSYPEGSGLESWPNNRLSDGRIATKVFFSSFSFLKFFVQSGLEAQPVSHTMGTGSFPGVKWPMCDDDHPPPSRGEAVNE